MPSTPNVLVPGFWLGAWAWGEVASVLRADGHDVTALTLPGLESVDADRPSITLADHVDAICTGFSAGQVRAVAAEEYAGLGGLNELREVTYVDLPTSHWPMWSRPRDLAAIIGNVAPGLHAA